MRRLISLSPTTLSLFEECPRCFWLRLNHGVRRPFIPFPSLPGGVEEKVKQHFDKYRKVGELPPEISGQFEGQLFANQQILDRWRDWRKGLGWYDVALNARMRGAIDDLVVQEGRYAPLDYKSRGNAPSSEGVQIYQTQLDCYALLLERNGFQSNGFGYLLFYYPTQVTGKGILHLRFVSLEIRVNIKRVEALFREAVDCLRRDMPLQSSSCSFCSWADQMAAQNFAT